MPRDTLVCKQEHEQIYIYMQDNNSIDIIHSSLLTTYSTFCRCSLAASLELDMSLLLAGERSLGEFDSVPDKPDMEEKILRRKGETSPESTIATQTWLLD